MILILTLVVLLLLTAFMLNGDRYGVVAVAMGSSAATIVLCAVFFGWVKRHPGGSFHGFLTAYRLIPVSGPSPAYLLGWLLVTIALTALLLLPLRIVRLPRGGLGYLVAWIGGLGVLLGQLSSAASSLPAIQFFLKFYGSDRTEPLLPADDASFQALVHIILPVVCNPVLQSLFTNHLAWIGYLLYPVPLAVWLIRLSVPALGEAKPLQLKHQVPPILFFLLGIFLLRPWQ